MSWLLILFAQNVFHIILSRIGNGIAGGGIFAIAPIFFSGRRIQVEVLMKKIGIDYLFYYLTHAINIDRYPIVPHL